MMRCAEECDNNLLFVYSFFSRLSMTEITDSEISARFFALGFKRLSADQTEYTYCYAFSRGIARGHSFDALLENMV